MGSRVLNPKFKKESLHRLSWTRITRKKDDFPASRPCVQCGQNVVRDEIVITIPVKINDKLETTVVIHKKCLVRFLAKVPDDLSVVKIRVDEITQAFREG